MWGVPQSYGSNQAAVSGNGYILIPTFDSIYLPVGGARGFAIGKLKQTLVAGKKYRVGYYVCLADSYIVACNYIGMHFSDTVPTFNSSMSAPSPAITPQIEFHQNLTDKENWIKLDTTYTATGTERFVTIANFRDNTQCHGIFVGGNVAQTSQVWDYAIYLIDSVFVIAEDGVGLSPSLSSAENGVGIFPNPNNGSFTLSYKRNITAPTFLAITDVYGKEIDNLAIENTTTNYQNNKLSNGIYFYSIKQNNNEIARGKIVVQH